jgi:hypothetical protein
MKAAGVAALAFWVVWSYLGAHHRFLVVLPQQPNTTIDVFHAFRQEKASRRVYVVFGRYMTAPWVFNPLVDDQGEFMIFDLRGNDVPRALDGRTPDVVVYFHGIEADLQKRLMREYPRGRLEGFKRKDSPPADPPSFYRFYIDGKDLRPDPRLLVRAVDVPPGSWSRRFYPFYYGLGYGVIEKEEWVRDPLQPSPMIDNNESAVVRGTIRIEKEGDYLFTVQGKNHAVLDIDGRRALDHRPTEIKPVGSRGKLALKAGEHSVVLKSYFRTSTDMPPIEVLFPGETQARPFGSFQPGR